MSLESCLPAASFKVHVSAKIYFFSCENALVFKVLRVRFLDKNMISLVEVRFTRHENLFFLKDDDLRDH
jgi:hypothetical protein